MQILIVVLISLLSVIFAHRLETVFPDGTEYTIDWTVDSETITLTITRNTTLPPDIEPPTEDSTAELSDIFKAHVPKHWFSLALNDQSSKITMPDSDFLLVNNINTGYECFLQDSFSSISANPLPDTQLGGKEDLTFLEANLAFTPSSEESPAPKLSSSCTFSRLLDTGDKFDVAIPNRLMILGWAYGDINDQGDRLQHRKTVRFRTINLITGQETETNTARYNDLYFWHAVLMCTAWLVFMIPGTFLARYLKAVVPTWYFIHWKVQAFGVLFALAGVIVAAVELRWNVPVDVHVVVGLTVFSLVLVQIILGYLSNALWYEGKAPHVWPDKLHWWIGRLVLLVGTVNVVLGLASYEEKDILNNGIGWSWAYIFYVAYIGIAVVAVIVFEVRVGQQHEHLMESDASTQVGSNDDDEEEYTGDKEQAGLLQQPSVTSNFWSNRVVHVFSLTTFIVLILITGGLLLTLYFA